jgi:hypothetical protein
MFHYCRVLGVAAVFCGTAFAHSSVQEQPALADGVIHVALPPGKVRMENIVRGGKPLLRLTVGKTVIETRTLFLGDSKGVQQFEAIKEGMHWVPAKGGKGFVIDGVDAREPGSTIAVEDYLKVENLKAGSLYVTTPSINFLWGAAAKPKGNP